MSLTTDTQESRDIASEIKFLITPALGAGIRDWARTRLAPDPYGSGAAGDEYETTTLYFDTRDLDVFHRRGSFGRSKYRVRRYGANEVVYLERKLKTRGRLTKRRTVVMVGDLDRLSEGASDGGWPGRWFHRRLLMRRLRPVCQVSYRRTARVAMTHHGPLRLTLDEEIRASDLAAIGFSAEAGRPIVSGQVVLELKYRVEMPAVFKELVSEFKLAPGPVSKYRLGVAALGRVPSQAPPSSESGDGDTLHA